MKLIDDIGLSHLIEKLKALIGLKADKTYVDNKVKTDVPVGAKFTDTLSPNLTLTRLTLGNYEIVYNEIDDSLDVEVLEWAK